MKNTSVVDKPHNVLEYVIEIVSLVGVMLLTAILLYAVSYLVSL